VPRKPFAVEDMSIGQLLLRAGRLTEQDVVDIVEQQRQTGLRFGDTAARLGLVTEEDVQQALARQYSYPYPRTGESRLNPLLVAAHRPFSAQAEALRGLRTQLMQRWFKDKSKVLALVPPRGNVASSVLAANLAIVFAQLGERTLLIDANLRSSRQQELFNLGEGVGLGGILASRAPFKHAPQLIEPFENLYVLCAGPAVPNPQELLGGTMFSYVMETAPAAYDVVVVDAPPVLEYADAQLVAAAARGVAIPVRRHHTSIADVDATRQLLAASGAAVLGGVICE
jgi:chain length determinant protein tyrosine kinase EpsG